MYFGKSAGANLTLFAQERQGGIIGRNILDWAEAQLNDGQSPPGLPNVANSDFVGRSSEL